MRWTRSISNAAQSHMSPLIDFYVDAKLFHADSLPPPPPLFDIVEYYTRRLEGKK